MKVQIEVNPTTKLITITPTPSNLPTETILAGLMLGLDLFANTTLIEAMNSEVDPDLRLFCKKIYSMFMEYEENYIKKHGRPI